MNTGDITEGEIPELPPPCEYGQLPTDMLFSLPDCPEGTYTLFRKSRSGVNPASGTHYPVPWCVCADNAIIQPYTYEQPCK